MADNRLVHNTTLAPVVVSSEGRRVLGCSSATIDISETRAQKYLANGTLILVNGQFASPETTDEPTEK